MVLILIAAIQRPGRPQRGVRRSLFGARNGQIRTTNAERRIATVGLGSRLREGERYAWGERRLYMPQETAIAEAIALSVNQESHRL
jgi:hypothetical protein